MNQYRSLEFHPPMYHIAASSITVWNLPRGKRLATISYGSFGGGSSSLEEEDLPVAATVLPAVVASVSAPVPSVVMSSQ